MSVSKNDIKFVQSLRLKKFRQKYNNFIAEGEKIAGEALLSSSYKILRIFALPEWLHDHATQLTRIPPAAISEASENELAKISGLSTPNKVLMVLEWPQPGELPLIQTALYLDDVQDPGNLGAILRIADWFAIPQVFCSPGSVDVYNPKVVQASMGAFLRVDSQEIELETLLHRQPELPVLGAVLDGDDLFAAPLPSSGILVVGNESKGIRPDTQHLLTHRIAIPRAPGGGAESLNAAVATGIITAFWVNRSSS
jgi:RNA methyltransferase, TrmH family